ncbi:MAG TPA: glycoside hydrolase family 9 protein [Symbiobacteriaceae bacterium]|nr:glycoside hydrolase family 9 protein [Symbiobacteriaceae bacterium]
MKRMALGVCLVIILSGCTSPGQEAEPEPSTPVEIAVNQVGYLPLAPKVATVIVAGGVPQGKPAAAFDVVRADTGKAVYSGTLKGPVEEPESSGGPAWLADFSGLKAEGTYTVQIKGGGESAPFRIAANIYSDIFQLSARSYNLQRCGTALNDALTGLKHDACHLQPSVLDQDRSAALDTTGGWHDAGDYGKYIPPAAITVGQLLMLVEFMPQTGGLALEGTTLLDEVRYELQWMLKMQRSDGAVYHKVTTEQFPGFILPERDTAPLLVYDVGTSSTALFAAATARAARTFAVTDPAFAQQLAVAAQKAWQWLGAHPGLIRPPVGNTGPYLAPSDRDAREWAAAELFALTGEVVYETFLKENPRTTASPPSWDNTGDMALLTYAFTPGADPAHKAAVVAVIQKEADERVEKAQRHPFGTALGVGEYKWASAKKALAIAQHLLLADRLVPNPAYASVAADQLNWVLGRNPLRKSFVTGVGADPPKHPHHRLVAATGKMVPGLLVGGPNADGQDRDAPPGLGPRSYIDVQGSYSTNEPAIDYNAPLVFVTGWFTAGRDFR